MKSNFSSTSNSVYHLIIWRFCFGLLSSKCFIIIPSDLTEEPHAISSPTSKGHPVCESNRWQFSICHLGPWSETFVGIAFAGSLEYVTCPIPWLIAYFDWMWNRRLLVEHLMWWSSARWWVILGRIFGFLLCRLCCCHSTQLMHCRDIVEIIAEIVIGEMSISFYYLDYFEKSNTFQY